MKPWNSIRFLTSSSITQNVNQDINCKTWLGDLDNHLMNAWGLNICGRFQYLISQSINVLTMFCVLVKYWYLTLGYINSVITGVNKERFSFEIRKPLPLWSELGMEFETIKLWVEMYLICAWKPIFEVSFNF